MKHQPQRESRKDLGKAPDFTPSESSSSLSRAGIGGMFPTFGDIALNTQVGVWRSVLKQ